MTTTPPKLFDRALIGRRLDRAIAAGAREAGADFLLARAAEELADRLTLVRREFADALDLGTPGPAAAQVLFSRASRVTRLAPTYASLGGGDFSGSVGDLERLPFAEQRFDLAVSLFALHHVNDLPGALIQTARALRPDGLMLAALAGGDTLTELRQSLIEAESEIRGGASPRVAPFADVRALGALMQRAGLALPVVDSDRLIVRYPDLLALMCDLRRFGAANALIDRSRAPPPRDLFARAQAVYAARFADPDGRLRATFEIVWLSGWAPHESQPKPLKPGAAAMRLEDAVARRVSPAPRRPTES